MSARALLDRFRAAGVLRPLDVHLAVALGRIAQARDPLALLGVAAASRVHGAGHICLELASFRDQVRDEAQEDGRGGAGDLLHTVAEVAVQGPAIWLETSAPS